MTGCLVIVLGLLQGSAGTAAKPADSATVVADVRALLGAVYANDVETLLRYSYPKLVAAMGGREAAASTLRKTLAVVHSAGLTLESFEFPQAPTFVPGAQGRTFVVVPTRTIVAGVGGRVESWNFQFGVREATSTDWTYLEGSRVTQEVLAAWFPDFPKDFTFPRVSREKL